jgi:hypothetical protein
MGYFKYLEWKDWKRFDLEKLLKESNLGIKIQISQLPIFDKLIGEGLNHQELTEMIVREYKIGISDYNNGDYIVLYGDDAIPFEDLPISNMKEAISFLKELMDGSPEDALKGLTLIRENPSILKYFEPNEIREYLEWINPVLVIPASLRMEGLSF